jgi:hypothetical protein
MGSLLCHERNLGKSFRSLRAFAWRCFAAFLASGIREALINTFSGTIKSGTEK